MQSYKGKVVVITGSAGGIGFALAKQFGLDGAKVVVSDMPGERIQTAISNLEELGIEAIGCACDVTDPAEFEALAEFTWSSFGRADVIVNNAGVAQAPTPLIEMDLEEFRRVFEVNIYGVLNGIQVFGKRFLEQGTPAGIYNLGSENSIYPCVPSCHAYVSSKHAVLAISELLDEETPDGIEVAVILPGFVDSEMTRGPLKGMDTDRFAEKVIEQLKAGGRYIVSHAYNKVRLDERHAAIGAAFDKYAPRYAGDDEFDVRSLIDKLS